MNREYKYCEYKGKIPNFLKTTVGNMSCITVKVSVNGSGDKLAMNVESVIVGTVRLHVSHIVFHVL